MRNRTEAILEFLAFGLGLIAFNLEMLEIYLRLAAMAIAATLHVFAAAPRRRRIIGALLLWAGAALTMLEHWAGDWSPITSLAVLLLIGGMHALHSVEAEAARTAR